MASFISKTMGRLIKPRAQELISACSNRACIDLPVVDVSPVINSFRGEKAPGYDKASTKLMDALKHRGFAFLLNTPVTAELNARTMDHATKLFKMSAKDKAKFTALPDTASPRGYYAFEAELADQDQIEAWQMGADQPGSLRADYFHRIGLAPEHWRHRHTQRNSWPGDNDVELDPTAFEADMRSLFEAFTTTSMALTAAILGQFLGRDAESLVQTMHSKGDHVLELKRYPMLATGEAVRFADHTDLSAVTLLLTDRGGGLQVLDGDVWLSVPSTPDAVLLNAGDFLSRWTCGAVPSTRHRVVNGPTRQSCVFFFTPNWDTPTTLKDTGEVPCDMVGDDMPF